MFQLEKERVRYSSSGWKVLSLFGSQGCNFPRKIYSAEHKTGGNFIHSFEITPVSRNGKRSEYSVLSHSAEDKKVWNSAPNFFVEEKNTRNLVISL